MHIMIYNIFSVADKYNFTFKEKLNDMKIRI